ncbi:MAG: sterol desaturase family protein [Gemmatimonadaceae bacterium]|nr:sterol desaturase family protein [Gemmatimonadaceae bacterium]
MASAKNDSTRVPGWAVATTVALGVGALLWAERRRALRTPSPAARSEGSERIVTNLVMAGLTAAVSTAAMAPVVAPLAERAERSRLGLTQRLPAQAWVRDAVAIVLLDYTLYWWHVLEHRVPWLYRFHQVHHADLALDTTTALRFHFGEFLASVPWRAAQVVLLGASPRALRVWQRLTMGSVLFHHSNARLPLRWERRLSQVMMTPRLHGIHHSIIIEEQDSNWSSGLSIWDRLHGTYRADVPQEDIEIGVAAYRAPDDVTLARSLVMPFRPLPATPPRDAVLASCANRDAGADAM